MRRVYRWDEDTDCKTLWSFASESGLLRTQMVYYLSYQIVTTPDGIIFHLYGPVEGRQPDAFLYRSSGPDEILCNGLKVNGTQYCMYGYQAHVISTRMQTA